MNRRRRLSRESCAQSEECICKRMHPPFLVELIRATCQPTRYLLSTFKHPKHLQPLLSSPTLIQHGRHTGFIFKVEEEIEASAERNCAQTGKDGVWRHRLAPRTRTSCLDGR